MNLPEYNRAVEQAVRMFDKRVEEARANLQEDLHSAQAKFFEEQPKENVAAPRLGEYEMKARDY